jgi:hypothetical protein
MKGREILYGMLLKSKERLVRRSPIILSCMAVAGVVATSVTAVRATPKAMTLLENGAALKGEELSGSEILRTAGPVYIPAIVMGVSTISCILGADIIGQRRLATVTGAYVLMDNAFREYRGKAKDLFGEDADTGIARAVEKDRYVESGVTAPDGKRIFYEEHYGKFFDRTEEEVIGAEYHLNRNLALRGYARLNEFYEFLGLPKTKTGETLGWSLGAGCAFYGYSWVDFAHLPVTMDDGMECLTISMPFLPTADYMDF